MADNTPAEINPDDVWYFETKTSLGEWASNKGYGAMPETKRIGGPDRVFRFTPVKVVPEHRTMSLVELHREYSRVGDEGTVVPEEPKTPAAIVKEDALTIILAMRQSYLEMGETGELSFIEARSKAQAAKEIVRAVEAGIQA